MITKPIPYGRQHITDEDIQCVIDALKSDYLTQGPKIKEFEEAFASYVGCKYAIAVNNATAGLHLAATALDVNLGDKVIVTPLTFAASANCIRFRGGEVVFCDVEEDTYLMDIKKLSRLLSQSPKGTYKGIVLVDFAGYPANLEAFRQLADEYGLWIIKKLSRLLSSLVMPCVRYRQSFSYNFLLFVVAIPPSPVAICFTG